MKKLLLFTIMALLTVVSAVAQTTTLSYQAVVRDASNKFVQDADISVDVSIITGGSEQYFESRTAHTNHNGVISFSIGGTGRVWPVAGHPTNDLSAVTGWADATITVTYHLSSGDVTVNSPVSAVPYALEVAPTAIPAQVQADWNESDNTTAAFIWNKPSFATVATTGSYNDLSDKPNAADYAKVAADNSFTGTNTVPSGFNIETTTVTNCGNVVVNACDLLTVFDSLSRRITALEDALDALMHAVPPTVTVSLSDIYSTSMKANAVANDNGIAIISYEFCISENSDMSSPTCFTSTTPIYTFTGLDAYKTYYVTAKATNLAGSATSSVVSARTPAHAPTATLSSDLPEIPTGFQVTVNGLDFREPEEGTVQIFYKQGTDCSADEDGFTAWPVSGTLYTNDDYTQNLTGLDPNTDYCVMVKVSNEDSTTTYGPVNTTSGDDISLIITPPASLSLCEGSTVSGVFFAEPSMGDVEEYTYVWSDGANTYTTNPVTMTFSTAGNKTITCTATNITDNFPLITTFTVSVTSAGTAPTISACESMLVVEVTSFSSDVVSIDWGDGSPKLSNPQPWPKSWHAYAAPGGTYDIVATNTSGCTATQTVSLGRAILTPCTGTVHALNEYEGQGFEGADDGREYADENGIYAVTDYDGNVYPVVQIGTQCWMAENLRTEHSPSTGSQILLGKDQTYGITSPQTRTSFTSKMAVWASGTDPSSSGHVKIPHIHNTTLVNGYYSEIVPRFGLLYNWCAAVDTFNTAYDEVSNTAQNTSGWKPVLNLVNGNRRGICPLGWHLPSAEEWDAMMESAGVVQRTGTSGSALGSGAGKLATGCYWDDNNTATAPGNYSYDERNSSGFSAVPGGTFNDSQNRYYIGQYAYFWTTTQDTSDNKKGIRYRINCDWAGAKPDTNNKNHGASVRCVRDAE